MERLRNLPGPAKFGIAGAATLLFVVVVSFVLTIAILAVANGILGVDMDSVPVSWTTVPIVLLGFLVWRKVYSALEPGRRQVEARE